MELVMFVGIPASGKSTETAKYRELGYEILSSDEIRETLTEGLPLGSLTEKEKTALNSRVFETIRKKTGEALKRGQSVVVDATNLSRKRRMSFLEQFRRYSCGKKCVLFITPEETCRQRNRSRLGNARVPEESMQRMLCNFECPNYWEGWDEILPVTDSEPYRFPFHQLQGFRQDNPHHTLTLEEHLSAAERYCEMQNFGEMLQRVAACHDIGKLYTKRFSNGRGEPTVHAHYHGHENYGAYLYLTQQCCGKTLTPEEFRQILYETNLINCHMRPMVCWDGEHSTREKDLRLFGEAFISDLTALHQADRAAH